MNTFAPADMLCFALYSANNAMQQTYQSLLEPLGLTYPQYIVLSALWRQDGQSMGALGRQVFLETNTLTPLVKRLEARGLLRRTRSVQDERRVLVTLTEAGRGLQARAPDVAMGFLDCSGLSAAEAQALRDTVLALRDRLKPPKGSGNP